MVKFFERCRDAKVPVFAHCEYGEFQAAEKYGEKNADPKYWRLLFEKSSGTLDPRGLCGFSLIYFK